MFIYSATPVMMTTIAAIFMLNMAHKLTAAR